MVAKLKPQAGDVVVELGPGTGVFTRELLAQGVRPADLILVEFNAGFATYLRSEFPDVCVLEGDAVLTYSVTNAYSGPHDGGFAWNDPEIGVVWPLDDPVLSDKDASLPLLRDGDPGFLYSAG